MRKTASEPGKFYRRVIAVLSVVFLLSAAFLALSLWERQQGKFPALENNEEFVSYQGEKYQRKDRMETFLVLGLDKFEGESQADSYNNDRQADFLLLFVFDHEAQKSTVLHLNRDTMTEMNILGVAGNKVGSVTQQLALSHTYGSGDDISCRNTANAVSKLLLGMPVSHYLSMTMDAVAIYNDLLGGVEVQVLDDFTGIDDTLVKGETVTLKGQQALTYVRTRYGLEDSSNSTRMVRQQQYLQAVQALTEQRMASDTEFLVNAGVKMGDYIVSDRSVTQLQELARKFYAYEFTGVKELQGESKKGEQYMEFYPEAESVEKTVIELFYEPRG